MVDIKLAEHRKEQPNHLQQESPPDAVDDVIPWKTLPVSHHAANTVDSIRVTLDALATISPNREKSLIALHVGDPTLTGRLPPCEVVVTALTDAVTSHKYDGYGPSVGHVETRQAIVNQFSSPSAPFTVDDVIVASGASHALQLAIEAIANAGDNILRPMPGFPLYTTLSRPHGIEDRRYRLIMKEEGAEVDLVHMESLIDAKTKAIIVNNPSNPTGAVFSKEHLKEILKIADRHRLIIIADEIYGDLTYDGAEFTPIATLLPQVPVITCDGIGKRWLVPGWRLGWVIVHDRFAVLGNVKKGMVSLSQKLLGPCSLVQGAIPSILLNTPPTFFNNITAVLSSNASIVCNSLRSVPGLQPVRPYGSMYMLIGVDRSTYGDELSFVQGLIKEQSVFCLPGSTFSAPNYFRVVLAHPEDVTLEACQRIAKYCDDRRLHDCKTSIDLETKVNPAVSENNSDNSSKTLECISR